MYTEKYQTKYFIKQTGSLLKYQSFLLKGLVFVIVLFLWNTNLKAGVFSAGSANLTYDPCSGRANISLNTYIKDCTTCSDDYMNQVFYYYWENGGWRKFAYSPQTGFNRPAYAEPGVGGNVAASGSGGATTTQYVSVDMPNSVLQSGQVRLLVQFWAEDDDHDNTPLSATKTINITAIPVPTVPTTTTDRCDLLVTARLVRKPLARQYQAGRTIASL